MNVVLYSIFSKKRNSTKLPDGTANSFDGFLKSGSTILSPSISFAFNADEGQGKAAVYNPRLFTYAYITDWNRYYFVRNWEWDKGLWTVSLEEDLLATYRNDIKDTVFVMKRAYSSDWSAYPMLDDPKILPEYTYTESTKSISTPFVNPVYPFTSSTIILLTQGAAGNIYFVFPYPSLISVMYKIYPTLVTGTLAEAALQSVEQTFLVGGTGNIADFTHMIFLPISMSSISSAVSSDKQQLYIGNYMPEDLTLNYLTKTNVTFGPYTVSFDKHPSSALMPCLNSVKYTHLSLEMQPFGQIDLDPLDFISADVDTYNQTVYSIVYRIVLNLVSGDCLLKIYSSQNTDHLLKVVRANVAQPIKFVGMGLNVSQIAGLAGGFASVLSGGVSSVL